MNYDEIRREEVRAYNRDYMRRRRGSAAFDRTSYDLKRRYGVDSVQRQSMLEAQDGKCAICRDEASLHMDHDHDTRVVRGLLCRECNTGLGKFKDDPELMQRAINYLVQSLSKTS